MISNYGNTREAMRMASIIANMANEGRPWAEIHHVTGIAFDLYDIGTVDSDQRYPIAHLGTVRTQEDIVVSRTDENSLWTASVGGQALSVIRKKRETAMNASASNLNVYRSLRAAERDAKRAQSLANAGHTWTHIRQELELELAVFAPGTLWPEQTEEVVFLGVVNEAFEVLIVREATEKSWQIRIVQ